MIDLDHLARLFVSHAFELSGVYRLVIQPDSVLREYRTRKHGFLFVVRGTAALTVNGSTVYELQPGSVFHAPPGVLLDSHVVGSQEYEYYTVFYSPGESMACLDHPPHHLHFELTPGVNPKIKEWLLLLHQSSALSDPLERLRAKELFLGLLYQVLSVCRRLGKGSSHKDMIGEAVAYLNGHYMEPLTLDELARLHALSPKQFSYYFHKYTGLRPIDYLIQYRLERAAELLRTGQYAIRDVAISVGYADPFYFSRAFKKKYGCSPSSLK